MAGKIKIDDRESNFIFNGFKKESIEYDVERLPIGDFVFGNCAIEHKTVEDFVKSVRRGHLQKQLIQQESNFKHSFLIISGDLSRLIFNKYMKGVSYEQVSGMIISTCVRFPKTKVLQTYPIAKAYKKYENKVIASLVKKIIDKTEDGKTYSLHDTELLKSSFTTDDMRLKLLSCFPLVGIKKGKKILDESATVASSLDVFIDMMKKNGYYKDKVLE